MFDHLLRRTGVAVLAGTVAAAGLVSTAATPAQAADPVTSNATAAWLTAQLGPDDLLNGKVGDTMDFGLSLLASGTATPDLLARINSGIQVGTADFISSSWDPKAANAKAAYYFEAMDLDSSALVAQTKADVDDTGKLGDGSVFGQVWAVWALQHADDPEAEAAKDALVAGQCADGAWGFSCDGGQDFDYTALSVLALHDFPGDVEAEQAIARAVTWLKSEVSADGAFGESTYTPDNVNSTGLVSWALGRVGETALATKAADWVRARVVAGGPCDGRLAGDSGAVAYDSATLAEGRTDGITDATRGTWLLSSAQTLAGLANASAPGTLNASAPSFAKASSTVTVKATGLAAGTNGCISVAGKHLAIQGGGTTSAAVALPAGTRAYPATVKVAGASAATTVVALARKKLPVLLRKSRVHRGARQHVKVAGLYRGESVKVAYGGRVVARGKANANGVFRGKFKVRRSTGVKKVKVRGHFGTRTRTVKFRVVR